MKRKIVIFVLLAFLYSSCMTDFETQHDEFPTTNQSGTQKTEFSEKKSLKKGSDLEKELFTAIMNKNLISIEAILERGANPNLPVYGFAYKMVDGKKEEMATYPVFQIVTFSKNNPKQAIEILSLLKDKGGLDPTLRDNYGNTALDHVFFTKSDFSSKLALLEWFLQNGVDPTEIPPEVEYKGGTYTPNPLFIDILDEKNLSTEEKAEVLRLFQRYGADMNKKNHKGNTALYVLASGSSTIPDSPRLVQVLIELGADPNIPCKYWFIWSGSGEHDSNLDYPPHAALDNKKITEDERSKMIAAFLEGGADPNLADDKGYSFFQSFLGKTGIRNYMELLRLFLRSGADTGYINSYGYNAFESILRASERLKERGIDIRDVLKLMISEGVDIDTPYGDGSTLLFKAASKRKTDLVRWLLKNGADGTHRDKNGNTVLHALFETDKPIDVAFLKMLMNLGVDLNARGSFGNTPLSIAAKYKDFTEYVKILVEAGAKINIANENETTPLGVAMQKGATKTAEYLRAQGGTPYISQYPVGNKSPACRAVLTGDTSEARRISLETFTSPVARTSDGVPASPLHLVVESANTGLVKALSDRRVDWNVGDRYGRTPLQIAIAQGKIRIADLLLAAGADVNKKDNYGNSPLSIAITKQPHYAEKLIRQGVVPTNRSPLASAIWMGNLELVKLLSKHTDIHQNEAGFPASIGQTEITKYLSTVVEHEELSRGELIARAQKNKNKFDSFSRDVSRTFSGISKNSGGNAHREGRYTWIIESYSPWMEEKLAENKKLQDYPLAVSIPKNYDRTKTYGLLVSMIHAKSKNQFPREAFQEILDRHGIIWVGFDPYNGVFVPFERNHECLSLAAVYNLFRNYSIDPERIYMAGFSWGGRLTGEIVPRRPEIFSGGIAIDGCFTTGERLVPGFEYGKKHITMVMCTGDFDYNRLETYGGYNLLHSIGYENCHFIQQPLKAHAIISPENFERSLRLLEGED